jgi:hypothetical protein
MGAIVGFLAGVLLLCVLGICVLGAISETVRARKDFKKIEQQWRGRRSL